jgi:sec-independent protein translocase protein TatC
VTGHAALLYRERQRAGPLRAIAYRAGICLAAYVVAFTLVILPIPSVSELTPTQVAVGLLAAPAEGHLFGCDFCGQETIFRYRAYVQSAAFLAFVTIQPVLMYQLLALASPAAGNRKRLSLATFATVVAFIFGLLFGYILVLPVAIGFAINWNPIDISINWKFTAYIDKVSTLLFYTGLAFQWPVLLASLARLNRLPRQRSAR